MTYYVVMLNDSPEMVLTCKARADEVRRKLNCPDVGMIVHVRTVGDYDEKLERYVYDTVRARFGRDRKTPPGR